MRQYCYWRSTTDGSHMPSIDEGGYLRELIAGDDLRPPALGVSIMIRRSEPPTTQTLPIAFCYVIEPITQFAIAPGFFLPRVV